MHHAEHRQIEQVVRKGQAVGLKCAKPFHALVAARVAQFFPFRSDTRYEHY